jgi:hypothetical protein
VFDSLARPWLRIGTVGKCVVLSLWPSSRSRVQEAEERVEADSASNFEVGACDNVRSPCRVRNIGRMRPSPSRGFKSPPPTSGAGSAHCSASKPSKPRAGEESSHNVPKSITTSIAGDARTERGSPCDGYRPHKAWEPDTASKESSFPLRQRVLLKLQEVRQCRT